MTSHDGVADEDDVNDGTVYGFSWLLEADIDELVVGEP